MKSSSFFLHVRVLTALALSSATFGAKPESGLTEQFLKQYYFKSIRAEKGDLVLQLKVREGSILYRRGEQRPASAASGETITVHPGESLAFISRHGSLKLTPLSKPFDRLGFLVRKTFDARSFGGGVTRQDVIILILAQGGLRFVETPSGLEPAHPLPADLQQKLTDLIDQRPALSSHSLHAETPGGNAATPFPASTTKVVFAWKLRQGASGEPLGARWIAADTGGVAPPNRLISSSKSEPGRTEGSFTLGKPTDGFPPGKYRVEIWQAGKKIFEEQFEITNR